MEPGEAVARSGRGRAVGLEGGEGATEQHLAIRLHRQAKDAAARIGIEVHVQRAVGIKPGDAVARHSEHGGKGTPDQHLAIRLHGYARYGAVRIGIKVRIEIAGQNQLEIRGDVHIHHHSGLGAWIDGRAIAPVHEAVAGGRHGGDGGASGAVVDRLRRGAGDRTVGAGGVGEGITTDGEIGGDAAVCHHVGVGAWVGGGAIAPADEVVAGPWHGGDTGASGAVVDGLGSGAGERAVGACGVSEGEGVDGEVRRHVHIGRHVGVGARVVDGAIAPVYKVVAGGRDGGDGGAAGAGDHKLRRAAGERAVGARRVSQGG